MPMTANAIEINDLSKRYMLGEDQPGRSLRETLASAVRRLGRRDARQRDEIWSLRNVTFDVAEGNALGVIGRNGAGKSTLLKILSRITEPTEGIVRTRGRVAALLEVGTGFHPELTGRENVYLNGAILGMSRRDTARRFDEIVSFAGGERFVDTPVKRYSSGMYLRLAFAVAAHLEPDILIVDEVLAVGDAQFQRKCLGKMGEVSGEGRTVLLVSHNMGAVTALATRVLWLEDGRVRAIGEPSDVVAAYLSEGHATDEPGYADLRNPALRQGVPKRTHKEVLVEHARLVDGDGETTSVFFEGEPMRIELGMRSSAPASCLEVVVRVTTMDGTLVFTLTSGLMDVDIEPGPFELPIDIPALPLRRGTYQFDFYVLTTLPQDDLRSVLEFEIAGPRGLVDDPRHARDYLGLVAVEHEFGPLSQGGRAEATAVQRAS